MMPRLKSSRLKPQGRGLNAAQFVLLSFVSVIALGTLLLRLPFAQQSGSSRWIDDLFMATSAVCVTGLLSVDPGTTYSRFGEIVLMLLVQIGGLGYMTLFTLALVMVRQRISLRDRLNFQTATDAPGMLGLRSFVINIAAFTLLIESIGFLLFCRVTVPEFGWGQGLYMAAFHVISAFNNAGFSLFSEGAAHWQGQFLPLAILMGLAIIGSLGYPVNYELIQRLIRRRRRPQLDALLAVVLVTTAILLIGPAILLFLFERENPMTLGSMSWPQQLLNAFFLAVQPRSSGFHVIPTAELTDPSLMLMMGLMFVGGAPGGTAGGIKITTAVVLVAAVAAAIRGSGDANLLGMKRRVGESMVRKALAVLVLTAGLVFLVTMALLITESLAFRTLLFEAISAIGTVGLSVGATAGLSDAGKLIIALAMLIGRIGVIMVVLALFPVRKTSAVRYPEEPMLVG